MVQVVGYDPVVPDHLGGAVNDGINQDLEGVPLGRDIVMVAMVLVLVLAVLLMLLLMLLMLWLRWLVVLLFMLSMKMIHLGGDLRSLISGATSKLEKVGQVIHLTRLELT